MNHKYPEAEGSGALHHATTLISPTRLDVFTKVSFVRSWLSGYGREFSSSLYRDYLLKSNGKKDFNEDGKRTILDYESAFIQLISSLSRKGFDGEPIPYGKLGITNGAHRLAASLVLNLEVERSDTDEPDQIYDYLFMRRIGLDENYIEHSVLEFLNFEKRARCFLLTDFSSEEEKEFIKKLRDYSSIVYAGSWDFSPIGIRRVLDLAYGHLEWWNQSQYEVLLAERFTEPRQTYPVSLVIHLPDKKDTSSVSIKSQMRAAFSNKTFERNIHESDNHFETKRLCQTLLNFNGRFFLNESPINSEEAVLRIFDEDNISTEKHAVSGSSILSLFTGYQAADLDLISWDHNIFRTVSEHEAVYSLSPFMLGEIFFNPKQHFVYKGVKFVSLPVWTGMRIANLEPKVRTQMASLSDLNYSAAPTRVYRGSGLQFSALRYRRTKAIADKLRVVSRFIPAPVLHRLRAIMSKLYS